MLRLFGKRFELARHRSRKFEHLVIFGGVHDAPVGDRLAIIDSDIIEQAPSRLDFLRRRRRMGGKRSGCRREDNRKPGERAQENSRHGPRP